MSNINYNYKKYVSCHACNGSRYIDYCSVCNSMNDLPHEHQKGDKWYLAKTVSHKCKSCDGKGGYTAYYEKGRWGDEEVYREYSSSGGCFVSTATLKAIGKSDNCNELTEFRNFRDNWVILNHSEIIAEYYNIAPIIVAEIEKRDNSVDIYQYIWENFLSIGYAKITKKDYESAYEIYLEMMKYLKVKYPTRSPTSKQK
jgi:hypothetical protein